MIRKLILTSVLFFTAALALAKAPPRARFIFDELEKKVLAEELAVGGLKPGTERKFVFASPQQKYPTVQSILYLHGFSASRMEMYPLSELLAHEFHANLFLGRLRGHGIKGADGLKGVHVEDWQADVRRDLDVARQLGKRVTVIAVSTAAPLIVHEALANPGQIDNLILLSPNFGVSRWDSELLLWPIGRILLKWTMGEYRQWAPVNSQQEYYWTTRYPAESLIEMMKAMDLGRKSALEKLKIPTQIIYSANDEILDLGAVKKAFARIGAEKKDLFEIDEPGVGHILAGNIVSPKSTNLVKKRISEFLSAPLR